jgi:hypothetical protein
MDTFTYRPAALRGERTFRVTGAGLVCETADGAEQWRLDWAEVARAVFVDQTVRGVRLRRLDLVSGRGVRRSIGYNGPSGPGGPDPDARTHMALLAAIAHRLAQRRPDATIALGEYGVTRLVLFGIGVGAVLAAVGLAAAALASGLSGDRLAAATVPVALLGLIGLVTAHASAPWRPLPRVPAAGFAELAAQMGGGDGGGPPGDGG